MNKFITTLGILIIGAWLLVGIYDWKIRPYFLSSGINRIVKLTCPRLSQEIIGDNFYRCLRQRIDINGAICHDDICKIYFDFEKK